MKRINIFYWICTGLFCAFMIMASVTDLIPTKEASEGFRHLGYPQYLLAFLGVARILGAIALIVPGFPRLKEWAYAGFAFDMIGAIYSEIAIGDPLVYNLLAVVMLGLEAASYILYHKRRKTLAAHRQHAAGDNSAHTFSNARPA